MDKPIAIERRAVFSPLTICYTQVFVVFFMHWSWYLRRHTICKESEAAWVITGRTWEEGGEQLSPVSTTRVDGPSTRVVETGLYSCGCCQTDHAVRLVLSQSINRLRCSYTASYQSSPPTTTTAANHRNCTLCWDANPQPLIGHVSQNPCRNWFIAATETEKLSRFQQQQEQEIQQLEVREDIENAVNSNWRDRKFSEPVICRKKTFKKQL